MRRPPRGMPALAGLVQATQVLPVWRAPECPKGHAAAPVGGGGARTTHRQQAPPDWRPPRDTPRHRWAAAGPGRTTSRRASHTSATWPHWCGGHRRDRRARASHAQRQAPPDWRPPRGLQGLAGLRGAAPNEVRPPSLAGGQATRRPETWRGNEHRRRSDGAASTAERRSLRTPRSTPGSGRPGGRRGARAR